MVAHSHPPIEIVHKTNYESNSTFYDTYSSIQRKSDDIKRTCQFTEALTNLLKTDSTDNNLKQKITANLVSFLILTGSQKITFEKTPEDSYLVKADYRDSNYFLAIYFDKEISEGYECFLNVFKNQKYVANFQGELDTVFLKLIDC